ncbi:MAG: cell division topological specificity factor MinE [Legionellales bacterium]|nr:MAG: cell division topological specificity factor MinE [Legionellales bacterium]
MNIIEFFKSLRNNDSASVAKERLQILVSHQRMDEKTAEFMPRLRAELIAVINKYMHVPEEQINVNLQNQGGHSTLELNVVLPEE